MTEVVLFVGIASLLVLGAATLVVATLALRTARKYVHLAEERMERLREGQARLLAVRTDERRMDLLERELAQLRGSRRESALPAAAVVSKDHREAHGVAQRGESPSRNAWEGGKVPPTSFLETSARKKPADGPPGDGRPRVGVGHPHPDDATGSTPASSERARSGAPVGMFLKHYEKYLENYRGYVELAEHLYRDRARDDGEAKPGSFEENHREERLRRINDGIARTIGRLDILEGQNPGLAAEDLVSRRARVARRHSELRVNAEATETH